MCTEYFLAGYDLYPTCHGSEKRWLSSQIGVLESKSNRLDGLLDKLEQHINKPGLTEAFL